MTLFARLAQRVSGAVPSLRPRAAPRFAPALPLRGSDLPAARPAPSIAAAAPLAVQPAGRRAGPAVVMPAPLEALAPVERPRRALPELAPTVGARVTPTDHDAPGGPIADPGTHVISTAPPAIAPAAAGEPKSVGPVLHDPVAPVLAAVSAMAPEPPPWAAFGTDLAAPEEEGARPSNPDFLQRPAAAPTSAPGRGRLNRTVSPPAEPATVVEVRIGAIEVHTPPPSAPIARAESRLMSLDAYLAKGRR